MLALALEALEGLAAFALEPALPPESPLLLELLFEFMVQQPNPEQLNLDWRSPGPARERAGRRKHAGRDRNRAQRL